MRYDESLQKRVVYEPVKLVTQEYRQFDFMSPWEGAEYILPGDEKDGAAKGVRTEAQADGTERSRKRMIEAVCYARYDVFADMCHERFQMTLVED